jgi:P27 family predicted phage terminase small subunit
MPGRKRKSPHLHAVEGTARTDRINSRAPVAPTKPPRAPAWLSKRATEIFGQLTARLEGMEIASSAHTEMLALAAFRLEEVELRDADVLAIGAVNPKLEVIELPGEDGKMVATVQKVWKANPAVAMRSEAMRHAQSLLAEFGLSPSACGKVSTDKLPGASSNPWEELKANVRRRPA